MEDVEVRPPVTHPTTYGGLSPSTQWHEYPSGLIDLSRPSSGISSNPAGPELEGGSGCFDLPVVGKRRVRVRAELGAVVVVDMQNVFLMPELGQHPSGLDCAEPILRTVRHLRDMGLKIIWLNWGIEESTKLPAALDREFKLAFPRAASGSGGRGLGAPLPNDLGRLLYKGEPNTEMWAPLQEEYESHRSRSAGGDRWVDKQRMSGFLGRGGELERVLEEEGRRTLFVAGINADQSVANTVVDAFALGYDVIALKDCIATTTTWPEGAKEQLLFNMLHEYGFVTDSEKVLETKLA